MSQDFGGGKFVKGRKVHRCNACGGVIPKGERHYNYRGMYDGDWQNWRMHDECFHGYENDPEGDCEFSEGDFPIPERILKLSR